MLHHIDADLVADGSRAPKLSVGSKTRLYWKVMLCVFSFPIVWRRSAGRGRGSSVLTQTGTRRLEDPVPSS